MSFDIVIKLISTCYIADVRKVYRQVYRVLKFEDYFITGFVNPVFYALNQDHDKIKKMKLIYSTPYSDIKSLN